MQAWPDIETLAEDMKISSRTAWRWLKSGKVIRKRAEGGGFIFVLREGTVTDNGDTDMSIVSPTDVSNMSEDVPDREPASRPSRHHRFLKRGVIVAHPSPELKRERESTESLKLRVERAKLQNELARVTESETKEGTQKKRSQWVERWIRFSSSSLIAISTWRQRLVLRRWFQTY